MSKEYRVEKSVTVWSNRRKRSGHKMGWIGEKKNTLLDYKPMISVDESKSLGRKLLDRVERWIGGRKYD